MRQKLATVQRDLQVRSERIVSSRERKERLLPPGWDADSRRHGWFGHVKRWPM